MYIAEWWRPMCKRQNGPSSYVLLKRDDFYDERLFSPRRWLTPNNSDIIDPRAK